MHLSFYSVLALAAFAFAMTLYSLSTIGAFLRTRDEPEISPQTAHGIFAFATHYFFGLLISCVLTLLHPTHPYFFAPVVLFGVSSIFIFTHFIMN
jgi:hypothetical protein